MHLPRRATGLFAIATLSIAAIAACTPAANSRVGTVSGMTPSCFGPGTNDNLEHRIKIRAERADGLSRTIEVNTSSGNGRYRMVLPAGRYRISTYSGAVHVVVAAGRVERHVDLPQPGCI